MNNQRRIVVLSRWVTFIALAYLLWGAGAATSGAGIALLGVMAASNVGLSLLDPGHWEHPALLPVLALLDIGVLTASMILGRGFAVDFFLAYLVLLAAVALLPTVRWAAVATVVTVLGYGSYVGVATGWNLMQSPDLLGRLGFLFSVGITYGGLTEAGKLWLREAALESQLRETMERSERMEVVSQVTTSVTHSLNSLLSTVLLSAESLRRDSLKAGVLDPEGEQKFQAIDLAVKEGMTIVERLAAWTRLQRSPADGSGRDTVLEPARLLEDAWRYAQPQWVRRKSTRELRMKLDIDETPHIAGHAAELREVLLNMILNAIDAMPKGGDLTLGIEQIEGRVCFSVTDTGVGMTEEQLERVFEPLYTTKGSAGTGLGLTIARSVAHRHHGEITADSRAGVGSRFCLWLSAVDARADEGDGSSTGRVVTAAEPGAGRVLLVDGNELVRDVMVRLLQTLDYEPDTVDTVEEALVMMGSGRRYQGLLVDAGLVHSEAETFLDRLQDHVSGLPERVLFYSTHGQSDELRELQPIHRFGFVDRSAGLARLVEALQSQLGSAEPGRSAA